jgi:CRP-like cAMP-binding protein
MPLAAKPSQVCPNILLNTLTPAAFAALAPSITYVDMPLKKVFSKGSKPPREVYFPCSGMFSLVRTLEDGSASEVGLIGKEGFVGVQVLLGANSSPLEALVQGPGSAIAMSTTAFLKLTDGNAPFRKRLLLYAQALLVQVSQTAVCNARHKVPQRLARWLLETHDRMQHDVLHLSHEMLSYMLGVRRAGVSEALKSFSDQGLLTTRAGKLLICNRPGIEQIACECYRTVHKELKRLGA